MSSNTSKKKRVQNETLALVVTGPGERDGGQLGEEVARPAAVDEREDAVRIDMAQGWELNPE